MASEENKALIRHLNALMNAGRLDAADALFAPDAISHTAGRTHDRAAARANAANTRASQPDLQTSIDALVAEDDLVVARVTLRGTDTGHLSSVSGLEVPASGRSVTCTGMLMYRIADGKIAESWAELDRLNLMQQIGVVPAPTPARAT